MDLTGLRVGERDPEAVSKHLQGFSVSSHKKFILVAGILNIFKKLCNEPSALNVHGQP